MVVHAFNPSTQETESRRSELEARLVFIQVLRQSELHNKDPVSKKKKKKKKKNYKEENGMNQEEQY
jgi:hypothetical protein